MRSNLRCWLQDLHLYGWKYWHFWKNIRVSSNLNLLLWCFSKYLTISLLKMIFFLFFKNANISLFLYWINGLKFEAEITLAPSFCCIEEWIISAGGFTWGRMRHYMYILQPTKSHFSKLMTTVWYCPCGSAYDGNGVTYWSSVSSGEYS